MKLKTISIIPAPLGSWIVEGPHSIDDEDSCYISPCAFLALVEDHNGESHVIPVAFGYEMDAELTHHTTTLEHSKDAAEKEMQRRVGVVKNRIEKAKQTKPTP